MDSGFIDRTDLELKRAERYAVFLSLVVLDLSFLGEKLGDRATEIVDSVCQAIRETVREIDAVGPLGSMKIGLLFPETPRQGAEIVGRRVGDQVRSIISKRDSAGVDRPIPVEMASYPDAAGARTIAQFLEDLADSARN